MKRKVLCDEIVKRKQGVAYSGPVVHFYAIRSHWGLMFVLKLIFFDATWGEVQMDKVIQVSDSNGLD